MTNGTLFSHPLLKEKPRVKSWSDVYEGRGENRERIPYLKLHPQTGFIYVRKYKAGRGELFESTGYTLKNLRKAKSAAEEKIAQWLRNENTKKKLRSVSEIVDELAASLKKDFENQDRALDTHSHDRTYFPIIKEHFGHEQIEDINEKYWKDWIRDKGRGLNRTLGDIAKYLSKTLTYAFQEGYIKFKPKISNPDKSESTAVLYETPEIETFYKYADPFLQDLIIIAAECGLRPIESRELRWEYIDFKMDCTVINLPFRNQTKRRARSMIVSENITTMLKRRSQSKTGPFVFPSPTDSNRPVSKKVISDRWRKMLKAAGLQPGTKFFKWFRSSFFTNALLIANEPLAKVSEYGGNSPAILVKHYLKNDPRKTQSVANVVKLKLDDIKNDS